MSEPHWKSIAAAHAFARVASVCPTCSGDIWPRRAIGLVDGQWICDWCFLIDVTQFPGGGPDA